jgi:hypothetical protein
MVFAQLCPPAPTPAHPTKARFAPLHFDQCFQLADFRLQKTQKWLNKNISGRTNLQPNFGQIFQKGAKFLKCLVSFIFHT